MSGYKKYLLFAGHRFYPAGGYDDFRGDFETIESAKKWFGENHKKISDNYKDHWGHVVNAETFEIVARFEQGFIGTVGDCEPGPVVDVSINET